MLSLITITTTVVLFLVVKKINCNDVELKFIDERCLNCFCQAQTKCNTSYGCVNNLCGPYKISYYYWIDGGKLGLTTNSSDNEENAFRKCSNNKLCAEENIKKYMAAYKKDCNDNGVIDCVDYFRIHLSGQNGCTLKLLEERLEWLRFLECYLNTAPDIYAAFISIGSKMNRL